MKMMTHRYLKSMAALLLIVCMMLVPLGGMMVTAADAVNTGDVFAPDAGSWGTQNNKGWYWMYKTAVGEYKEMKYFATSTINWQKNAFASDPDAMGEMFFINPNSFFTGELGSLPVYAFKAPSGGQIQLTVSTHGSSDMQLRIYNGNTLAKIGGEDAIAFTTTGTAGGFMVTTLTIDVKKNTMVYLEGYTTGSSREGWIKDYSAKYLSTNSEVEDENNYIGKVLAPDLKNAWGKQNNNNWYYMYKDRLTGDIKEIPYNTDSVFSYLFLHAQQWISVSVHQRGHLPRIRFGRLPGIRF